MACRKNAPPQPVIPDGHILAPTLTVWLAADAYMAGRSWHRRDWLRNYHRVGEGLAANVTTGMVTRHGLTWEALAADAGVSRTTLADRLRWRREHGLIAVITTGSTNATRKGNQWGRLDDGLGNLAAEYALIVPVAALEEMYGPDWDAELGLVDAPAPVEDDVPWPVETVTRRPMFPQVNTLGDETRTPAPAVVDLREESLPHARENQAATTPAWPMHQTPTSKKTRIAAADRLRAENMTLRHLSARDVARLLRPLFELGATVVDARHALETHPVHGQWANPTSVLERGQGWRGRRQLVRLRGLLEARVAAWVGADGQLVAALPSQVRAAADERRRAEQQAWREHLAAVRASARPL